MCYNICLGSDLMEKFILSEMCDKNFSKAVNEIDFSITRLYQC